MTEFQQFIRRRAREMSHLYCAVCRQRPPRFVQGTCPGCEHTASRHYDGPAHGHPARSGGRHSPGVASAYRRG